MKTVQKKRPGNEERRRKELAMIHIARKQLGIDEADYRSMLSSVAGVVSAADLDHDGREKVLDHLRQCGFIPAHKSAKASGMHLKPSADRSPYLGKIGRLLTEMDLSWAYADGIAKRMFGVRFVRWLRPDQLQKVLIALNYKMKKKI